MTTPPVAPSALPPRGATPVARQSRFHGMRLMFGFAALALLSACATVNDYRNPRVAVADTTPPVPTAQPVPQPTNGAIYQAAAYRPLFEDHRARLPGDTLMISITEKISASQKSTSSVDKSGELEAAVTALPGINPNSFVGARARATAGMNANNTFAGKGATESSNEFTGSITAVVTGVLPNGHLLIAGEKQIGVNANVDTLRFSGQVDPRAIQPGNTVQSIHVANVRLEQKSRGQQGEAQVMGWLARIFMNVLPI
jgi:flagellar L-ring protein FlgH